MLFQIKVLSPLWSFCGLAAVGEAGLHPDNLCLTTDKHCVQIQGNLKVSEAEEPKKAGR